MNEVSLFNHLKEGDINSCHRYLDRASIGGKELVKYLNTLLYYSVSVNWTKDAKYHPIIVTNSIKNIIADGRDNPSKILLKYGLDILIGKQIRDDNKYLTNIESTGTTSTVFVGNLQDAIQSGDWEKAKILNAKVFLASDRSRAIIDTLVDLGLQNVDANALFIFHILRAFHFKQKKSQIWTYACCLINILQLESLPGPHNKKQLNPNKLLDLVLSSNDPELLMTFLSVSRIWNGEYVRYRSYRREISHWLYKTKSLIKKNKMAQSEIVINQNLDQNNYISIAEQIILQGSSLEDISKKIVLLEAVRHCSKTEPIKNLYYYINRTMAV
tara:strand:- start:3 stop:986 length:984 start_codon:yes stop_codon:yes gene_type:complete